MFIKRMKLICKTQGRGGAKGDLRSQHDPPGPGPRAGKALQATPGQLSSPLPLPPADLPGAGQCAAETHRLGRDGCHSTAPCPWDSGALRSAQLQHGLLTHGMRWNLVKRQTWSGPEILHF